MTGFNTHSAGCLRLGTALTALAFSSIAHAQPQPATTLPQSAATDAPTDQDIIVTGTLLRGVASTGTNVLSLTPQAITASGVATTNQLMATVPQVAGFNDIPQIQTGSNTQVTVTRPRLRNIGAADNGGSATLLLMDGHRMVGAGIRQTTPDPDVIPPSVLERVDVALDGGSSTYGSDAVAGVINFVTRRHYNGLDATARYGIGDSYHSVDANLIAGKDWGSGSAYIAYSYAWNSGILGKDRDFVQRTDYINHVSMDLTCNPGNVSFRAAGTTTYALPGRVPGTLNRCDTSDLATYTPEQRRHSVFASLSQDFGDSIKLDVRGFYTQRTTTSIAGPFRSTSTITAANPFYVNIPGTLTSGQPQTVAYSWEPVFGASAARQRSVLDTWGITPTASIALNGNWRARVMGNYGESTTKAVNPGLNPTLLTAALAGTTTDTAVNPYDIASTPNKALLANIANYQYYARAKQKMANARIIVDGRLFALPGGDVQLAVGAEYLYESFSTSSGNGVPSAVGSLPILSANRNSKSVFGELSMPVFGADNRTGGFYSLILNASARYDHYSDFGETFNPKLGFDYKPVNWLKIRGNWGKSFQAPSLADSQAAVNSVTVFNAGTINNPYQLPSSTQLPAVALQGGLPGLQAQKADTWSIGTEISPPFLPGLVATLTYYNVDFRNEVGAPPTSNPTVFYKYYTDFFIMNPTQAQVSALASQIPGGLAIIAPLYVPGALPVYAIVDARRANLAHEKFTGLDFSLDYRRSTSFGSIDAKVAGTYELTRQTQGVFTLPFVDNLASDYSRFRFITSVGANVGNLRAQAQLSHTAGYKMAPLLAYAYQTHMSAFDVVNLFFQYDVKGRDRITKDLTFTLNIDNVADARPPILYGINFNGNGYNNGNTLGRVFRFGVNKKF